MWLTLSTCYSQSGPATHRPCLHLVWILGHPITGGQLSVQMHASDRSDHVQRWSGPHVTTFSQQYVCSAPWSTLKDRLLNWRLVCPHKTAVWCPFGSLWCKWHVWVLLPAGIKANVREHTDCLHWFHHLTSYMQHPQTPFKYCTIWESCNSFVQQLWQILKLSCLLIDSALSAKY